MQGQENNIALSGCNIFILTDKLESALKAETFFLSKSRQSVLVIICNAWCVINMKNWLFTLSLSQTK